MNIDIDMNDLLDEIDYEEQEESFNMVIFENAAPDFDDVIVERGIDYHNRGKVLSVVNDKNNGFFKAVVEGSYDNKYYVSIEYDLNDEYKYVDCKCSCPCDFYCKHEYAVLLAIKEGNYDEINLKERVSKKLYSFREVLEEIPAKEIKEFLLSKDGVNTIKIDNDLFEKRFIKYIPVQSYEYYYNNLYNDVVLEGADNERLGKCFDIVVDYFSAKLYKEVFKIMKAMIEVYHDTNNMNSRNFVIDIFPKIAMFVRVVYSNCDEELKTNMLLWAIDIKNSNYYDSIFLQDVIDGIEKR